MVPLDGPDVLAPERDNAVDRALLERPLEKGVRPYRDRNDHDSGGTDVEAVHDALALVHPEVVIR